MKNESDDKILSWYMQFIISQNIFFYFPQRRPSGVAFLLKLFFSKNYVTGKFNQTIKIFWSINQKLDTFFFLCRSINSFTPLNYLCERFAVGDLTISIFFSVSVCLVHRGQNRIDKNQNRWVLRSFV